jgi:hypothetical protein
VKALPMAIGIASLLIAESATMRAHNFGSNPPTWNRELSRLVYDRCAGCHRQGGSAFPMITYQDVQPRAVAIKDAVLSRRMPPWGAVKGFGEFSADQGLTQEQVELFSDWLEGGMLKGNNPNVKPDVPKFDVKPADAVPAGGTVVRGTMTLSRGMTLSGIIPERVPANASLQITATLPDGRVEPLVWLYEYRDQFRHPFMFRAPLRLPAGTRIGGVKPPAVVRFLESR